MAKVLISVDDDLLRRIDRRARARGLTRSAYVAQLAQQDTTDAVGPGAGATVRRSMERLDALFADHQQDDSTAAIRSERDSH
ncbi:MAG: ribbon-helix-helix protein, CopG family [Actinomycetota bacterium]|nr:ribbon-helix-helix protein, CopG family [Actinomycetota bacterium]